MDCTRNHDDLLLLDDIHDIRVYLYARAENAIVVPMCVIKPDYTDRTTDVELRADGLDLYSIVAKVRGCANLQSDDWARLVSYLKRKPASDFPENYSSRMSEIRAIANQVQALNRDRRDWRDYVSPQALLDACPVPTATVTQEHMDTLAAIRDTLEAAVREYASRNDGTAVSGRNDAMARLDQADDYAHKLYGAGNAVPVHVMDAYLEFAATIREFYGI